MVKEEWWRSFLKGYDQYYTIYNHAKFPKDISSHSILYKHHTKKHIVTKWANFSLVRATIIMMEEAVRDPENTRFVLCSDSCVPIQDFEELHKFLILNNITLVKYNPDYHKLEDSRRRYLLFDGKDIISRYDFKKQHQWCVFNREAVCAILQHYKEYAHYFLRVFAVDEHFFINLLEILHIPYVNYQITFVHFGEGDSHPHVIQKIDTSDIEELRRQGFFFMRKVSHKLRLVEHI